MNILFVGEKKSETALRKGWSWKDGRLAAKQLFDALVANNIDPSTVSFANAYDTRDSNKIKTHDGVVVGMGLKAQARLSRMGVEHIAMIHPAARGRIRDKRQYAAHVASVLMLT